MPDIKILILCGGRGMRLRPLTDSIPKPLIPLHGKPIIHHSIESFIRKGFNQFIVCVGYKGDMIEEYLLKQNFDAQIEFCNSGNNASMLSRIKDAVPLLSESTIVAYGDTLIDIDLNKLLESHTISRANATIVTADVKSPFGLVKTNRNRQAYDFEEKPIQSYYIGHMVLQKSIVNKLDSNLVLRPDGAGLVELFKQLIKNNQLYTYQYDGPQITFNTPRELNQAHNDFISFFTHQEEPI